MPRPRAKQQPEVEVRRGHPALKYNQELADQFGIRPAVEVPEAPREVVHVDSLPDPPDVDRPEIPDRRTGAIEANPEDHIVTILREEMDELGERLGRFGINLDASGKQTIVDYCLAVLGGYASGGAIARRQ